MVVTVSVSVAFCVRVRVCCRIFFSAFKMLFHLCKKKVLPPVAKTLQHLVFPGSLPTKVVKNEQSEILCHFQINWSGRYGNLCPVEHCGHLESGQESCTDKWGRRNMRNWINGRVWESSWRGSEGSDRFSFSHRCTANLPSTQLQSFDDCDQPLPYPQLIWWHLIVVHF